MTKLILSVFLSLLSSGFSQEQPTAPALSTLHFANGDTLSGSMIQLQQNTLSFHSPQFQEDSLQLALASLLELHLPKTPNAAALETDTHLATLTLSDRIGTPRQRDQIQGEILKITAESITLSTAFAGIVDVDQSLVSSISIGSTITPFYTGPNSLDEWDFTDSYSAWSFQEGVLKSSNGYSSIAKDLNFPEKSQLQFTSTSSEQPSFSAYLYADKSKSSRPSNFYHFKVQNGRIYMSSSTTKNRSLALQPSVTQQAELKEGTNTFTLYMNREKGIFHVFANDQYINTFTDSLAPLDKLGTYLYFRDDRGQILELSNIAASEWIGAAPIPGDPKLEKQLSGEGQTIHLANGDMIRGVLGEIVDSAISIKTRFATFKVPLAGITILGQRNSLNNQAKEDINDVRAHFHSGGWIIIDVDHIDATHIHGNNEALGDCQFRIDAFERIEFNIYDRHLNDIRSASKL